jgi:hypothetical protein
LSLKQTCDDHDEKVDFYCSDHQQLCCMKCTRTSHRDCTSVCSITEVVLDVNKGNNKLPNSEQSYKGKVKTLII